MHGPTPSELPMTPLSGTDQGRHAGPRRCRPCRVTVAMPTRPRRLGLAVYGQLGPLDPRRRGWLLGRQFNSYRAPVPDVEATAGLWSARQSLGARPSRSVLRWRRDRSSCRSADAIAWRRSIAVRSLAMPRSLVVRTKDEAVEQLVEESTVPTEAALHEVLMRHPSLVPASDLGFERMTTVGFEASLASGSADLVLLDRRGRICLVEVKKEGNPDTRRVIAQLLDYAAALWGMTLDEFEAQVLRRKLGVDDPRGLAAFVADEVLGDSEDVEEETQRLLEALGETLRSGDFALVLAAPTITVGVERVIEYLNARGLSVFGLEVSYFAGEVECFVPRIVVRPTVGTRIAGRDAHPQRPSAEPDSFFEELDEQARGPLRSFLNDAVAAGAELRWNPTGPRIGLPRGGNVIATFELGIAYLHVGPRKGIPPEPRQAAAQRLQLLGNARVGKSWASMKWATAQPEDIDSFMSVAIDLTHQLLS
jgi:hypothetical protein